MVKRLKDLLALLIPKDTDEKEYAQRFIEVYWKTNE